MKTYLLFLAGSSLALALFYAVYWFFLRKETYFRVNRYFLIGALVLSVIIPLFPVRYQANAETGSFDLSAIASLQGKTGPAGIHFAGSDLSDIILTALAVIYLTGAFLFLIRLVIQTVRLLRIFHTSPATVLGDVFIIENQQYRTPFSFINLIFYNPEYHDREELEEIIAHEQVHIHEHHWIDLLIAELWGVVFWFNPFVWLLERSIRQNHEYLADAGVLAQGRPVGRYQALLINQLMGSQVLALANHLNFSLNATRFKMMTKKETPRIRVMRLTWALPVIALLLWAFAEPGSRNSHDSADPSTAQTTPAGATGSEKISGIVLNPDGKPVEGAAIVIKGTTTGTLTDKEGNFILKVPGMKDVTLVISCVGFETVALKVDEKGADPKLTVEMKRAVIAIDPVSDLAPPPPPPPPAGKGKSTGVKDDASSGKEEKFVIVEEMPQYPGGAYALNQHVLQMQKKLAEEKGIKGKAVVQFTVNEEGYAVDPEIKNQDNEAAGDGAKAIVKSLLQWQPGRQRGRAVPVLYVLKVEF